MLPGPIWLGRSLPEVALQAEVCTNSGKLLLLKRGKVVMPVSITYVAVSDACSFWL